jgi:hypothetical protein
MNMGRAAQQLARAGVRLAQLLDSIKWQIHDPNDP